MENIQDILPTSLDLYFKLGTRLVRLTDTTGNRKRAKSMNNRDLTDKWATDNNYNYDNKRCMYTNYYNNGIHVPFHCTCTCMLCTYQVYTAPKSSYNNNNYGIHNTLYHVSIVMNNFNYAHHIIIKNLELKV